MNKHSWQQQQKFGYVEMFLLDQSYQHVFKFLTKCFSTKSKHYGLTKKFNRVHDLITKVGKMTDPVMKSQNIDRAN